MHSNAAAPRMSTGVNQTAVARGNRNTMHQARIPLIRFPHYTDNANAGNGTPIITDGIGH